MATVVGDEPSALRSSSDTIASASVGEPFSSISENAWIPAALANVPRFMCPGVFAPAKPLRPSRVNRSLLGTRLPSTRNAHLGAARICTELSDSHRCIKIANRPSGVAVASVSSHPSVMRVIFTAAIGPFAGHWDSRSKRKPWRASTRDLHPAHTGGDGDEQNATTAAPNFNSPGSPLP